MFEKGLQLKETIFLGGKKKYICNFLPPQVTQKENTMFDEISVHRTAEEMCRNIWLFKTTNVNVQVQKLTWDLYIKHCLISTVKDSLTGSPSAEGK